MRLVAIVREVSPSIAQCELTCIARDPIDVDRVIAQHHAYVDALRAGGASDVRVLPELKDYADSMFVEDVAVCFRDCAIITRPGAVSRQGETQHIEAELKSAMGSRPVFTVEAPGTVDGGDVLVVGKLVFVGSSTRSNDAGFEQLAGFLRPRGYTVEQVRVHGCLHLKSAASMITATTILINPEWISATVFLQHGLHVVSVDPSEPHSANVLSFSPDGVSTVVVVPAAFPKLASRLREVFRSHSNVGGSAEPVATTVATVEVDEIAKAEGALTCCSLLVYDE